MGARVKNYGSAGDCGLIFLRQQVRGELARIAHPSEWGLGWDTGIVKIAEIAALLQDGPERLLLSGGGFITSYLPSDRTASLPLFNEIVAQHIADLDQARGHLDVCVGVDLLDGKKRAIGQGMVFVGAFGSTVAWKTLPVGEEKKYVATFAPELVPEIPRYVNTEHGVVGLMVCHDLQMANHRTKALVRSHTSRGRVITTMQRQLKREAPELILNAVHWVDGLSNTKTFRTSLIQIVNDNASVERAAAAFGYGGAIRSDADLLTVFDRLKYPEFLTTDLTFKITGL